MLTLATHGKTCWLFEISDGAFAAVADLQIPPPQDWVEVEGGFAAVIEDNPKVFLIHEDCYQARTSIIDLPSVVHPTSITAWRDWIFVSGHTSSESPETPRTLPRDAFVRPSDDHWHIPILLACRGHAADSEWKSIYPAALRDRKGFDALFVHDGRLIAVDNIVMPKYLVVFKLSVNGVDEPMLVELPAHGTYEAVIAVAFGAAHLAVLSSTVGEAGSARQVSVIDLAKFEECGLIENFSPMGSSEQEGDETSKILFHASSIAVISDIIVVACGYKGLAVASLLETNVAHDQNEVDVYEVIKFTANGEKKTSYFGSYRTPSLNHTLQVWCPPEIVNRSVISARTIGGADAVLLTCLEPNGSYGPVLLQGDRLRALMEYEAPV